MIRRFSHLGRLGVGVLVLSAATAGSLCGTASAARELAFIAQGPSAADFDGDGRVAFADFLLFVKKFHLRSTDQDFDPRYDLDGDGVVGFPDFLTFSGEFGRKAAVLQSGSYEVYVVDLVDNSVVGFDYNTHLIQHFLPFRQPTGIGVSADARTIYISEIFGFFALNTDHEVDYSVPTNSSGRVALSLDGRTAYVSEQQFERVLVINLATQAVVDTVGVGLGPSEVAISPDGATLYVVNQAERNVSVVRLDSLEEVTRISPGGQPAIVLPSPDGKRVYISNLSGGVAVVDALTRRVVGAIQLGTSGTLGLQLSPDAATLYVTGDGNLFAVDAERNLLENTLRVADSSGQLGVSPDGRRAYVSTYMATEGGAGLTVVDLESWSIMGRMRGFGLPLQIAFRDLAPAAASAP